MEEFTAHSTRYLCNIIEDMRKAYETRNFSYLLGMIEELQYRANRMEDRLDAFREVERMEDRRIELKKEIKKLKREKNKLDDRT
jgi:hypothetical protein